MNDTDNRQGQLIGGLQANSTETDHSSEPSKVSSFAGKETILIVEDDKIVRELLTKILGHLGYNVLASRDGGEAILLCRTYNKPIHLLCSDAVMPQMNGNELSKKLLAIIPKLKIIFTSGYPRDVVSNYCVFDQSANFVPKPYIRNELVGKVREVLNDQEPI